MVEIEKTMIINASPEIVFKAITDPDELTNWFPESGYFRTQGWRKDEVQFFQKS